MKKNLYLFFALLFGIIVQAQNIKFLGSTKVTLSGTTQASSLNYTIPSGSNRIVIVSFDIERIHSESGGDNHITRTFSAGTSTASYDSRIFPFKIGSKTATPLNNTYNFSCQCRTSSVSNATLSNYYISYYLTEADGIPTGNVSFDWSGIYRGRPNAGDEMSVVVTVFENVSSNLAPKVVAYYGPVPGGNNTATITTSSAGRTPNPVQVGRTANDRMFLSGAMLSKDESITNTSNPSTWTQIDNFRITNNGGSYTYLASDVTKNEPDGISVRYDYATNFLNVPNYSVKRSDGTLVNNYKAIIVALDPLAKPSISGTVYFDSNGPSDIFGSGNNAGGSFVNLVDSNGNLVYSAPVSANGTYVIPVGYTTEGRTYSIQLSKNTGVIGQPAPITELNQGWSYVGESANNSGNDGTPDGKITNILANITNFTSYNFGVNKTNDNDGDGITDDVDLDNDNDGILDATEMYCDQAKAPNGNFPLATSPATTPTLTKQLLFWDWSNVTLDNTRNTATKSVVHNGITYTATITNFNAIVNSGDGNLYGFDMNTSSGSLATKYYNVNTSTFKEGLYTNGGIGTNTFDIKFSATDTNGKSYPIDAIILDSEQTTSGSEYIELKTNASPFKFLEKFGTGTLTSTQISGENTSTLRYNNTISTNGIYSTTGFDPSVNVTINRNGATDSRQGVAFAIRLYCDKDEDGIPNHYDLDSDNDGCPDAIEGGDDVKPGQLNPDGSINITSTGDIGRTSGSANYGVPNLVNPGGEADKDNAIGQPIGSSQDATVNSCSTNIEITKTNNQTLYRRPSTSVYTVSVKNLGSTPIKGINVSDPIPPGFGTADISWSANAKTGNYVRTSTGTNVIAIPTTQGLLNAYVDLVPGGEVVFTVNLKISEEKRGDITNTASITLPGSLQNTNPNGNSASDTDKPAIDARNDNFSNNLINPTNGGVAGNVTKNDLLNDVAQDKIDPTTYNQKFIYTLTNNGGTGATLDNNGNLIVPKGTQPGVYTLRYRICEKGSDGLSNGNCDSANIILEVYEDSDGDGISDVVDLDDDNDGILDTDENSICGSSSTTYFSEDFGTGTRISLDQYATTVSGRSVGTTNYTYTPSSYDSSNATATSINDGQYALLPNTANVASWAATPADVNGRAWININDHTTNNGTGRMALFNAKNSTSEEFYNVNNITNLPKNTTLKLTFWAMNLDMKPGNMNPYWDKSRSLPNIRIKVLNSDGTSLLKEMTTGAIPRDEQWHQYTVYFNTESFDIASFIMYNDMEGGLGNDLAIDDIKIRSICDTDGDGIPNELDLDSDNDGCSDAIEGAGNFTATQLTTASGTISTQTPNLNFGTAVDPVTGIPTIVGNAGQGIGNAYNAAINDCKCIKPAMLTGTALDTNVGVSAIGKTAGWPQNRKGAFIALESQTKGLVISRMTSTEVDAILTPQEGMMVYDTTNDCVKIYSKDFNKTSYSWKCFNVQSCSDN